MDADALPAREAIRDLMARYHLAGDRGRLAEILDCFTANGVLEIDGETPLVGRDAIHARLARAIDERQPSSVRPLVRHHLTTCRIEVTSPREASAIAYFLVVTEIGLDHAGRYVDRFACDGGIWRLAQRRVVVEWMAEASRFPRAASR